MRARTVFVVILLMLGAAAAGYFARPHVALREPVAGSAAANTYQCSMHPQIVSDQPGLCPICQMELQRVDTHGHAAHPISARTPRVYRHPMRPDVTSPHPAKDEMGMDYIPVYDEDAAEPSTKTVAGRAGFTLSTQRQQLIGVTRAAVERRRLDGEIRANGTIAYDPALYQATVEYREAVSARRQLAGDALPEAHEGASGIVRAATLRLRQLGISDQQMREIAASGRNPVDLLLPGKSAWVYAQVYEYEMDTVHAGQTVTITTLAQPGRTYSGRVVAVDPILSASTRTARVRIQIAAADETLRPESFVQATIHVPSEEVIAVPADAVLPSGAQPIVFVIKDAGTFEPRAVQLGREAGGYYEVLAGLQPGEEVVTSANFLIDSESRFRAALAAFSGGRRAVGAGAGDRSEHGADSAAPAKTP